jgi:hypothetical protein
MSIFTEHVTSRRALLMAGLLVGVMPKAQATEKVKMAVYTMYRGEKDVAAGACNSANYSSRRWKAA